MNILIPSLNSTLTIFSLIILGYILSRKGIIKSDSSDVFSSYVFFIALPAEIFLASSNSSNAYGNEVTSYLLCYVISICILWLLIWLIYGGYFKKPLAEMGLNLIAIGQTNTAYLAIPIFIFFFGSSQLVIPVIIFQTTILTTISIIIIEMPASKTAFSIYSLLKKIPVIVIKNPLILAAMVGYMIMYLNLGKILPAHNFITGSLHIIAQTAMPIALIALGASFNEGKKNKFSPIEIKEIIYGVGLKNIVHPLCAFILGKYVLHLNHSLLLGVTLISAMPSPKNTFILAQAYNISSRKYNAILLLTTLISFFIINFICIFT